MRAHAGSDVARDGGGSAVLHARAVALAMRNQAATGADRMQVLEFAVGEATYAVETIFVSEVFPVADVAFIPGTPEFVLGVVSVRGSIVSVVDLRPLFGAPISGDRIPANVIVLRSGAMEFSLAADAVNEVKELPHESVQQSLATLAGTSEDYVLGVTPERVVVLDTAKLLADPRLLVRHGLDRTGTTMGEST